MANDLTQASHSASHVGLASALKPTLLANVLFFLLFSGPPKFRIRDPLDIMYGDVDLAVIVNVVVWLLGGIWVAYQFAQLWNNKSHQVQWWRTQKLALVLIGLLAASTVVSASPELTAFKVYQVLVAFLFGVVFIEQYGVERCLDRFLWCSLALCGLIAVFVFVDPDLVLFPSETGFPRLRGLGITDTATIASFAIILLWTTRRRIPRILFWLLAAFLGTLLFFSLARIAWIAVSVFFAIALLRKPKIQNFSSVYLFWILGLTAVSIGLYSKLAELRDPESIYNLSERIGLWSYLTIITLTQSPWLGLGFVAGVRKYGVEYDVPLGSGHSIFFEAFVGGGILSAIVFIVLFLVLAVHVRKLLGQRKDSVTFAVCALFLAMMVLGSIGEDLDTSPFGFAFWCMITILPLLRSKFLKSAPLKLAT